MYFTYIPDLIFQNCLGKRKRDEIRQIPLDIVDYIKVIDLLNMRESINSNIKNKICDKNRKNKVLNCK